MRTSNLFENWSLKPRAETAQLLALICDTSSPGTIRNRSGIFLAPERWISSCVMTKIAAAACDNFCSFLETEVTSIFIRSSMLRSVRSAGFCWDQAGTVKHNDNTRPKYRLLRHQ